MRSKAAASTAPRSRASARAGDPSGMSAYGRWMYGPWFWPPASGTKYGPIPNPYYDAACKMDEPATWTYDTDPFCEPEQIPGTPNVSAGMEQFNDTPIVNGVAYPKVTLQPKTYRLRVLNAANDRFFNFQWYTADAGQGFGSGFAARLIMVVTLTTGSIFVMWLGEQITERGIGNGMSLLITFSILERVWPSALQLVQFVRTGVISPFGAIILLAVVVAVIGAVVAMTIAARRIPIQIPRKQVLGAMGQHYLYTLSLKMPAGNQRVAVAVRDELGAATSYLSRGVKVAPVQESATP